MVCLFFVLGCPAGEPATAPVSKTASDIPKTASETKPEAPVKGSSGPPLGAVLDGAPIPLNDFFGSPPADAEKFLGEPTAKGGTKKTCVRFVPEKTWFKCTHVWQRYADKTGTAKDIHVTYEDGNVASVAFEHIQGDGPFDPVAALKAVGLVLAGAPELTQPQDNVKLWSWWNSAARLVIGGRQYRVEVSLVDNKWESSKVDIILNDPLTDDEKSRVFEVKAHSGTQVADG